MRKLPRAQLLHSLLLAAAGVASVVACNTTDPTATPEEDAGVVVPPAIDEGGIPPVVPDAAGPDTSVVTPPPKKCTKPGDCTSGVCNLATGLCMAATCTDGVKNATETDIDCGADCPKCDQLKACKVAGDCTSGVCKDTGTGLKCQPPSSSDMVKNGNETGKDCGGVGNPLCPIGETCATRVDCDSDYCKMGVCAVIMPGDGEQNNGETDIDCGGPVEPARCNDGLKCLADSDCKSDVCKDLADGMGLRCQAPSYTDGKKNGVETDVDCGNDPTLTYACGTGLNCAANTDCKSGGCDYNNKCAPAPSCTAHYGGDTCGLGGEGGVGDAQWESCCKTIPVSTPSGGDVYMDKYPVTAGRMRAFLTAVGYNVRGFVQQARADGKIPKIPVTAATGANPTIDNVNPTLDAAWDLYLPVSFDGNQDAGEISDCSQGGTCTRADGECPGAALGEAPVACLQNTQQAGIYTSIKNHLGGRIFRNNVQTTTGCYVGSPGTHSFRFPDDDLDGAMPAQPVEVYDTKTLNCVDYLVGQAFCIWDGGRLETFQEWQAAWPAGQATPYTAQTATVPVEAAQRCRASSTCTAATVNVDCGNPIPADPNNPPAYQCVANKCCLTAGDRTYWGCRFPWATDATHPACGLSWPATTSIEYSDYKYSYEYPKLGGGDYIVHLSAPGRTRGRGPLGHSDVIGTGFELTSSVTHNASPHQGFHRWAGNGSWEVHNYNRSYTGRSQLLNKYGKLGLRCVKFAPPP